MSRRILSIFLLSAAAACTAPAPGDQTDPDPAADGVRGPGRDQDEARAERRRASASGRYLAKPTGLAAFGPPSVASLDIDPALNPTIVALTSPDADAARDLDQMGVIVPRRGSTFLMLATGRSADNAVHAEPGLDFGEIGVNGDATTIRIRLDVPASANRFSFDYAFLSAEYPEYVGTQFNDTFTVRVTDTLGADRVVASSSVNVAAFRAASAETVGPSPYLLYVDNPFGLDSVFDNGTLHDAGTTDFQRADIPIASGGQITVEFDIRDLGDGIVDSAVLIDNLAFRAVEVVDPLPIVRADGTVPTDPAILATQGTAITGVAADGVTQLLLRSTVAGPGKAVFSTVASTLDDGSFSGAAGTLAWTATTEVDTVELNGEHVVFALYRSPPAFARSAADDLLHTRPVALAMTFTPTGGGAPFTQTFEVVLNRPPVVVVPDMWSDCLAWAENVPAGAVQRDGLMAPGRHTEFTTSCVNYSATRSKGFAQNARAVPDAIAQALTTLRATRVAVTQVDVIGHGYGGLLARKHIDEVNFIGASNFNAGTIHRLITMNTPHLGSRFADEMIRMRQHSKNVLGNWTTLKTTLSRQNIFMDPVDGDIVIDEMRTDSNAINAIGAVAQPARSITYHAMYSNGGRVIPRTSANPIFGNTAPFIIGTQMERNHPTVAGPTIPNSEKERLIYGTQSIIFCVDTPTPIATTEDDHDFAFATTHEQIGGLAAGATSAFPVNSGAGGTAHYQLAADPGHTFEMKALLNQPRTSLKFVPDLPAPATVARINHCPITTPALPTQTLAPFAPLSLIEPTLTITSPAPGTIVSSGTILPLTLAYTGSEPGLLLVYTQGAFEIVDAPYTNVNLFVPHDASGTLFIEAVAFFDDGSVAIADPLPINVNIEATLQSISVLNGNIFVKRPGRTRQLQIIGRYSDGIPRDLTAASKGTTYTVSSLGTIATVSPDGVLTAIESGLGALTVKNGNVITSVNLEIGPRVCGDAELDPGEECDDGNNLSGDHCSATCVKENEAPVAVCTAASTVCTDAGVCSASVTNLGAGSSDPDGDPISITQSPAGPYGVGAHAIGVTVSDGELAATCTANLDVLDCEAPAIACPASFTAECTAATGTSITVPPATATDNCSATATSPAPGPLGLGTHDLVYAASDPSGNGATCTSQVTVQDTTAPALVCPPARTVECQALGYALVVPAASTATDACSTFTKTGPPTWIYPLGTTTVTYGATDALGNASSCQSTISVVDTRAPAIHLHDPDHLWPANHNYSTLSLEACDIQVQDQCGGTLQPNQYNARITCVTSDEPDNASGNADGNTTNDIVILDSQRLKLRRERHEGRDGRVYEIHFQVQDLAGNLANGTCRVAVPLKNCDDSPCGAVDSGDAQSVCQP